MRNYVTLHPDFNRQSFDWQHAMPGPTFAFAFVLATLIGALFHLIVGGDARRLALFLVVGWVGFALGQMLGVTFGVAIFMVGALRLVAAVVVAFFMLLLAHVFTSGRTRTRSRRTR